MTRIFISHSSKDQDFVRAVLKPLFEGPETLAWCSSTDMPLAEDWQRQIRSALAQTDWFLVVLSPDAQASAWVQAETHWALEHLGGRIWAEEGPGKGATLCFELPKKLAAGAE